MKPWQLILILPVAAFLAFFLFRATEACAQGSLRAPIYIGAVYAVAFLAFRRLGWSWRSRAVLIAGACHTCTALSLTIRANDASTITPLLPPLALAVAAAGYLVVTLHPGLEAAAVLDRCAVFSGLRFRLIIFFKLEGLGDIDVLLGEAWSRGSPFTVERLGGEVFLSKCFEGLLFGKVARVAEEDAAWLEEALRRAGFKPRRVEGWIEVERLLYAPALEGWEAAAFAPCVDGWRTMRLSRPTGRRGLSSAFRRRFEPSTLNPQPQTLLKAIIRSEEVLEVV